MYTGVSDSSESSESESSSGEDGTDDSGSEDSRQLAMLHLDEAFCPEGCDRDHYDEAFAVREKRYDMEKRIRDDQRAAEILQKELDTHRKRLKTIDNELQADRDKLNTFLREKQRQLNDIDVTVVLRLHQVQCFNLSGEAEKIQNCIVFDKATLSRLYSRVNELQQETANIEVKHKNDKIHFHKLKTDCETMKKELKTIKHTIKKEMEQKFGQQVSLVTLYEAVLRRLIYNIKADTKNLVKFYDEKIENVKIEYKHQLRVLKELIQDNTEKLSFLTVLEEEILKLNKNLKRKLMSEEEIEKLESQYESDLTKLKSILKNQAHQKECISKDIRNLRKSKPDLPTLEVPTRSISKILKEKSHLSDLASTSETKASSSVESSYYKKIFAIRHMLSEIVTVDGTNTKETIEEMLRELTENMQRSGYCKEEIEKNIIDIIQNSGDEVSQASSEDTIENVRKMVYRCNMKMKRKKCQWDIRYDVEDVLNRLFLSLGIQKDTDEIKDGLMYKLKMTENIDVALDYLMQNFASDIDDDMKESIREKIRPTLISLKENIKFAGCEEKESQEDACH